MHLVNTLLVLTVLFFTTTAFAPLNSYTKDPVKWTFKSIPLGDGTFDLVHTAILNGEWSIYSQHLEDEKGPIPTSIEYQKDGNFELLGEAREEGNKKVQYDETFDMKLIKFSKRAKFIQRVRVKDASKTVQGSVSFMVCNSETCLPPKDVDFEILLDLD